MLTKVSALERVVHRQGLVSTWVSSSEHNQIGEEDLRDERAARESQQDVRSSDTPPSTVQLVLRSDPDIGVADLPMTISTGMPMSFALRKWHEANEEV